MTSMYAAGDDPRLTGALTSATTLDQIAHPAADVSMNSHKLTNLTPGANPTDALTFGQLAAFGFPYTFDEIRSSSSDLVSVAAANGALYLRVKSGGTISKVAIQVRTSSGNISVAAYANSGTGRAAKPGTQLSTSGAVACPVAGYVEVALGGSVTLSPGDWLALSADNTTATFQGIPSTTVATATDSTWGNGRQWRQATAHPLPSSVGTLVAVLGYNLVMMGVA